MKPANDFFPVTVGKCIYCRSIQDLSDEHVIPYGLGGRWKLQLASCGDCRKVTSTYEGNVLSFGLGDLRERLGFRTRHKDRRTGFRPVHFERAGEDHSAVVPTTEHHGGSALPVLTAPTYLSNGPALDLPGVVALKFSFHTPSLQQLLAQLGTDTVKVPLVDRIDLARMLAKIGYAFAVACVGGDLEAFEEVFVLRTILEGPNAGHYVGCLPDLPKNTAKAGQHITLVRTPREVTTYIQLCAELGWPEYTVVVGRLRHSNEAEAA